MIEAPKLSENNPPYVAEKKTTIGYDPFPINVAPLTYLAQQKHNDFHVFVYLPFQELQISLFLYC